MLLGKKFLIIIIFFSHIIFYLQMTLILKGEKIFDEFKVNKRMKFDISGEWEANGKYSDYVEQGIK